MFVFVCWTPYQVFNAINFVMSDVEGAKNNTDIYIYHEFGNSEKLSEALKKSGIFNHVYDIEVYDKGKVWYSKFNKIKRLLMPYSTVKKYLKADIDVRKQGYKTLVISGNNLFSINLYNCIKGLQVYFIDDGTGTYFGDMRERDITTLYKIFNIVFNRGPMSYDVKKIYVNNKDICQTTICDTVVQLPLLRQNTEVEQKLKEVFNYKENTSYGEKKYIYLTQPLAETAIGEKAVDVENKILAEIKDKVLVRVHPRQPKEDYALYDTDPVNNLWELECVKQITDSHVLVGGFSTAQFVPKMLFDSEPTILFTYRLYGTQLVNADKTVEMLRSMYRNPEKITIVESMEELNNFFRENEENNE